MPTYEYACEACGHRFEEFQSITAKPIKKCPACKKNKVKRLVSGGAGFIFKGSGFYITDYRSDSYKAGEKNANGTTTNNATSDNAPKNQPAAANSEKPAQTPAAPKPAPKAAPAKK